MSEYVGWCEKCRERVKLGHPHPYYMGARTGPVEVVGAVPPRDFRPFHVGDKVLKAEGYEFDATVQAVFENRAGDVRLVCESLVIPGMLHIFSPGQMRHQETSEL